MGSRRSFLRAGLAGIMVLGLAGCGGPEDTWSNADLPHDAPSGGWARADMESAIRALPGIEDVSISGWEPNTKGNVGVALRFSLAAGYTVGRGPALITYLVESAWSVRQGYMPNAAITIAVRSSPEDPFDGPAAARAAGWLPAGGDLGRFNPETGYSVTEVWLPGHDGVRADSGLGARENLDRLGTWPGPVPATPDGLITRRP
ncbi:hypothetical protein GCG21_14520 [Pseudactinotalea sp. HY160]|uniref:hypothetical protein n=1 Tax=Pseudactinotalea sp. HY160 TaxID=2654490 RepID=UPI00128C32CF|nr:hypothetical protein [Pseudactinotalea sp. HY160]MPV51197.1 hypothetical protein [Pseudactinotalea sp. HY160]